MEYWKAKEEKALARRAEARNPFSYLFWQICYLNAVGNGGEAERFIGGLYDPHWGSLNDGTESAVAREAYRIGIERHNKHNRPDL